MSRVRVVGDATRVLLVLHPGALLTTYGGATVLLHSGRSRLRMDSPRAPAAGRGAGAVLRPGGGQALLEYYSSIENLGHLVSNFRAYTQRPLLLEYS